MKHKALLGFLEHGFRLGCHSIVTLRLWALSADTRRNGHQNFDNDLFISINRTTKRMTVRIRQRIRNLLSIVRHLCQQKERILLPCTFTGAQTHTICVRG